MFKHNLPLLLCFIDNMFGVWIPNRERKFEEFVSKINYYGPNILKWIPAKPGNTQTILDLRIKISTDNYRHFRTYQKERNLYPLLPVHSAHQPVLFDAMVIGMLPTYWKKNTDIEDYKYFSSQLITNLRNRGYKLEDIIKAYQRAA